MKKIEFFSPFFTNPTINTSIIQKQREKSQNKINKKDLKQKNNFNYSFIKNVKLI